MPKIEINIPGVPNAQKRHRRVNMGEYIRTYDPSVDEKKDFIYKAIYDCKPEKPIKTAIAMEIKFFMPRIKSHYGTGKNIDKLKENAPREHTKMPDIDNLVKFVCDSLNKIYWMDDRQIFRLDATKLYSENPRTEIILSWEP